MMVLTACLSLALAVVGLQDAPQLPGDHFARPRAGTTLRAGPGPNFLGVLGVDETTVLRVGEPQGSQRRVYVAQGYPVYFHRDFVRVSEDDREVWVEGERVNARLLPTTVGNLPVGQVGPGGPFVLLDEEGDWLRVLAPLGLPLYADPEQLIQVDDVGSAALRFGELSETRLVRQRDEVLAWRARHPEWLAQDKLLNDLLSLAEQDFSTLSTSDIAARRAQLAEFSGRVTWEESRSVISDLRGRLDQVAEVRAKVERSLDEVRRQERIEAQSIARESRVLDLGLRYQGRGEQVSRRGRLVRHLGEGGASVYALALDDGSRVKLTAAPDVADLTRWVDRRVEVDGRQLFLAAVSGPVVVVDTLRPSLP